VSVAALDPEYIANGRHWKARYQGLANGGTAGDLVPLLDERRVAIKRGLGRVRLALMDAGLSGDVAEAASEEVTVYCQHMAQLIDAQRRVVALDWPDLTALRQALSTRAETWASLLPTALAVADAEATLPLLTFAAEAFRGAVRAIEQADEFFKALEREVTSQERSLNADGDPVALFEEMRDSVTMIADGELTAHADEANGRGGDNG
jgi:hypothetical protein